MCGSLPCWPGIRNSLREVCRGHRWSGEKPWKTKSGNEMCCYCNWEKEDDRRLKNRRACAPGCKDMTVTEVWGETGSLCLVKDTFDPCSPLNVNAALCLVHLCTCIARAVDWLHICCNRIKSKLRWRVGLHQEFGISNIIIIIKYQRGWEAWQTCTSALVSDMRGNGFWQPRLLLPST